MADPTKHVLVLAGLTVVSGALRAALHARAARGPAEFTLLLPASEDGAAGHRERLLVAVERLRADGLDVAGQLGDPDPLLAVRQVWDPVEYDEIVLSTFPPGRSGWLERGVPRALERATGVPVAHVVAESP
ncbi:hypothetical protein [Conexibacter woesei]|uniref:UspA domain-containing protein n=1 Tax=Conexibacter woesei (strain DSM 14684 / CCUG 47730 / CIP 108061 / JCM 11494 / NBRC 100937 / ID131577) TaxID=469383 RepID=D3FE37_CONWI|nr:hypothetical protein [Conexibacter woesei]ADB51653.1 hypothetical protein Cwoe_3235 [Conexibacter woesei DSM 14684]